MVGADGWRELQRAQDHEKQARDNMNKSQNRIVRKQIIQRRELSSHGIGCDRGWLVASDYDGQEMHHPPDCDSRSNKGQENDGAP